MQKPIVAGDLLRSFFRDYFDLGNTLRSNGKKEMWIVMMSG